MLCVLAIVASAEARKPNVVVIYTDDQGSIDVNAYGAKDLVTPAMDSLCRDGLRFTQFYSASAVCSPSRAALLTGRVPVRAGVPGNVSSHPGGRGAMPAEQVTMAEMFKTAGYATAHIGKWHLGFTPPTMPNGQGFDYSFGHMGGCIDNYSHFFYWVPPNRHDLYENGKEIWRTGEYFPTLMVDEAAKFMEANREKPFFMYWAINLPHYPLQGTEKWRRRYAHIKDEKRRRYAAFMSSMDEAIGGLLEEIDSLGLREDTIVVFQSDHGHSVEERTFGGGGNPGPYRGAKFSYFEGGIRVPAMIRWPGKIPAGQVRGQFGVSVDWLPTLADYAGVPLPKRKLDGKNLAKVIESDDAKSPHSEFHWMGGGSNSQWAVREGDWKLIGNPRDPTRKTPLSKDDKLFLVNISIDVEEQKNLRYTHPDQLKRLKAIHERWVADLRGSE
ncbi:MAG: sulfatase-like hydrolase/transferase [Verrucomicrobiota bacterium]|nr:sulfatase-like hydrolase/transferase [Verrucomicrobiota bacterium]HJN83030.1 sulfatase-like hydrolase/transferase [Verrucomicrobiota bacterium]